MLIVGILQRDLLFFSFVFTMTRRFCRGVHAPKTNADVCTLASPSVSRRVSGLFRSLPVLICFYSRERRIRGDKLSGAIPRAPFLSGVRTGTGEGGGQPNRRADLYRLDVCLYLGLLAVVGMELVYRERC